MRNYEFFISVFEQVILFLPLTFGVFFSYVILQTTDITVDGSFVLGACVFASMTNISVDPILATICAVALGAIAGICVSIISRRNIIMPLIASILMLFMLQSINLQIMGRPNIGIPRNRTLFSLLPESGAFNTQILILIVCILFVSLVLYLLLKTRMGLFLRACGTNQKLFLQLGKNSECYRSFGLALSNALAAFCGTLTAQVNGYADISMGFGMALISIGTVTFGGQLLKAFLGQKKFSPFAELSSCIIGVTVYFLAVNTLFLIGIGSYQSQTVSRTWTCYTFKNGQTKKHGAVMKVKELLSISQLSLTSPINNRSILTDISYKVYPGDFVVILGENGSGKSSLLKMITKHYIPSSGSITFEGKDLHALSVCQQAQDIAIVTQDASDSLFYGFTVIENCLMYESIYANQPLKISRTRERYFYKDYLSSFSLDLANKLDSYVESLSGGQRQTLVLALCSRHHPKLLLLDEHTSVLDPKTAHHVMQNTYDTIKKRNITCIMTTHDLDEALMYGNRLIALKKGQIIFVADRQEKQLLTKKQLLECCY